MQQNIIKCCLNSPKRPGRQTDHTRPSTVEVKKEWRYTTTPAYIFMVCTWTTLLSPHNNYTVSTGYMSSVREYFFFSWLDSPSGPRPPHCQVSAITFTHNTLGRNPLDEWSGRRGHLYSTTHNRQPSMHSAGFEPVIPASEQPHTHAYDRAATGNGVKQYSRIKFYAEITWCTHILTKRTFQFVISHR